MECGKTDCKANRNKYVRLEIVETAELKSTITELLARVEKIRDWL
jgi:hypothetical protein